MNDTQGEAVSEQIRAAIEFCHGFDEAPDGDVASAELAALEARVVAAEQERDKAREGREIDRRILEGFREVAEGRLQAATDAMQEAHDLLAAYPSIHSDQSGFAHGNAREILATALARAVLVGGTEP